MKNLLLCLFVIVNCTFLIGNSFAQTVPQKMNYQGVARDAGGELIAEQSISVRIGITSSEIMNRPVYAEEHAVTTNKSGLFA